MTEWQVKRGKLLLLGLRRHSFSVFDQIQDQKFTRCDISKPNTAKPDTAKPDTAMPVL